MSLFSVAPCTRNHGDPEPGIRLLRMGEVLNRLSPAEARSLGADLIQAANASEAQWDSPGPRARTEPEEA